MHKNFRVLLADWWDYDKRGILW